MPLPKSGTSEKVTPVTWVVIIFLVVSVLITFVQNYKFNDNHLNWLNHDYAKNLLISTEQDSIFMTEGGDNQVFGSLYFIYGEKIRPDLTPYDQKGNIFKRIYGDMRYIDPQTLNRRMQMVDTHLFASEEPFYLNMKDRADPYFIPYWQGRRPVYLTWQRPDPWTLNGNYYLDSQIDTPQKVEKKLGLGEYYYKRYGIMYKVQNIAFSLVDYLELKKSISISEAQILFSNWLHKPVDRQFTLEKIGEMQKQGYLALSGDRVNFVKMYPAPHKGEYFSNMLLRWHEATNAMYWDNLSREIILNYDYQMGEIYRDKVNELIELKKQEKRPEILAEMDKRIKENWEKAKSYYKDAMIYGDDSLSILHNVAVVFMRNGIEDLDNEAHSLLVDAIKYYPNSWGTYSLMFSFLINGILKNPEKESANIKEAELYFEKLKTELSRYRSSGGDYKRHEVWKNFTGLENYFNLLKQAPSSQLLAMQNELNKQIKEKPGSVDPMLAQQVISLLYSRGFPFGFQPYIQAADNLFNKMISLKTGDTGFMNWAFSISLQLQRTEKAYEIGKVLERSNPKDPSFYYSFGLVCYGSGKMAEAKINLNKFLNLVQLDRKSLIQLRDPIENAKRVLAAIK